MATPHPSVVDGLHHVSLRVRDMERSMDLYRGMLGLPVKAAFDLNGNRFALLEAGSGRYIELVETGRDPRPAAEADVFGCEITRPITSLELVNRIGGRPFPVRVAFFRGPDGEEIELIEDETGQT